MIYAPILIPTLCRFEHFVRQIESLKKNSWARFTDIYVAVDYPPSEKYKNGWESICSYLINGDFRIFRSFNIFKRESNFGSSRNEITLLKEVLNKHDRWIRTDDDCEFSPNFIEFMDKCLEQYEHDLDVVAVTGYSYPVKWKCKDGTTCMKQNFNCSMWGTGFWKSKMNSYSNYIRSGQMLKDIDVVVREKRYERMIDATKTEYFPAATTWNPRRYVLMMRPTDMSMRSYLAVADKYVISPIISKVRNLGFDGSGEYCGNVSNGVPGEFSDNFNYATQKIDNNGGFEVVVDPELDLGDNLVLLNKFDRRTNAQMRFTRFLIFMLSHFGLIVTKIAHVCYKMCERIGLIKTAELHI